MSHTAEPLKSPYLIAEEAAAYLRYSSAGAFRRAVRKFGIPCLRRGRRMFFTQSDLDSFMAVASESTRGALARVRGKKRH